MLQLKIAESDNAGLKKRSELLFRKKKTSAESVAEARLHSQGVFTVANTLTLFSEKSHKHRVLYVT